MQRLMAVITSQSIAKTRLQAVYLELLLPHPASTYSSLGKHVKLKQFQEQQVS